MTKFWTTQNEKIIVSAGMGIAGYSILAKAFTQLPQLPTFVTNELVAGFSLLTIAGAAAIYGIYVLWVKY